MKRRDFFIQVGGVLVAVPAVLQMTACGDDGGGGAADAAAATTFSISSTMSGHVHSLMIVCADLGSSGDVTYTSGTANSHTHQVTIPAADLATIMGGGSVTISTSDNGHPHDWTISKPSSACPS